MRTLQLTFPFFKNKTPVVQLLPGEKQLVVKNDSAKTLTIILSNQNHLKFNMISLTDKEIVLNTHGFESFWLEKSGISSWGNAKVTVAIKLNPSV